MGHRERAYCADAPDLIDAAYANASPHQFIGRGMKVAKEEIIGLLSAIDIFVNEDEESETKKYTEMCQEVTDALIEVPGLSVSVMHDEYNYLIPHTVIKFGREWNGPSRDDVYDGLAEGTPRIYMHNLGNPDEFAFDPFNVHDEERQVVIRRLREELLK